MYDYIYLCSIYLYKKYIINYQYKYINISFNNIYNFINNFYKKTNIDESILICSIIYIDKILLDINNIYKFNNNFKFIIGISILLSSKINDDYNLFNIDIINLLNESLENINYYEIIYLNLINFNMFISKKLYYRYKYLIQNICIFN